MVSVQDAVNIKNFDNLNQLSAYFACTYLEGSKGISNILYNFKNLHSPNNLKMSSQRLQVALDRLTLIFDLRMQDFLTTEHVGLLIKATLMLSDERRLFQRLSKSITPTANYEFASLNNHLGIPTPQHQSSSLELLKCNSILQDKQKFKIVFTFLNEFHGELQEKMRIQAQLELVNSAKVKNGSTKPPFSHNFLSMTKNTKKA